MKRTSTALGLLSSATALAISAGTALAQDSTSNTAGLPGDAIDAYRVGATSEQFNDFVLDLSPRASSWGRSFAFGPLAKASRANTGGYFSHIVGAQSASARLSLLPMPRPAYSVWSGPMFGVNSQTNNTPGTISTTGLYGRRFAVGFMEFGWGNDGAFGTGDDENNIVAAVASFIHSRPNRLYVSRINALSNKLTAAGTMTASLGLGGIDEAGVVHAYADGYASTAATRLLQRNIVRVNSLSRNPASVNRLQESGFNDAAASANVRVSTTTMTVPTIISSLLPGGLARPVVLALDFASDYIHEATAGTTTTTKSYLTGGAGSARGTLSFTPSPFQATGGASTVGVGASLLRTDSNTRTRGIQLFGVQSNGAPTNPLQLILPTVSAFLNDPSDGFAPGSAFPPLGTHEFTNYASQVPFRGGSGQVATVVLPNGDLLAAALVSATATGGTVPQSQDNYLAVARVTPAGAASWTVAAHTGNASGSAGTLSKAILGDYGADGIPGTNDPGEGDGIIDSTPIGRIAKASEVFANTTTGPSISSPAFDRAGNLYFFATVAINSVSGTEYTTALLRANRNPANNSYQLELLLKLGDVIQGANSSLNYQVQYLGLSDADSTDSGSIFASNSVRDLIPGVDPGVLTTPTNPNTLGALAFRARIVYDVNNDGLFIDPSGVGGASSPDQAYNVVMLIMPRIRVGDANRDGLIDLSDLLVFLDFWLPALGSNNPGSFADWNGDGVIDLADLLAFLDDWLPNLGT